jgi:hypothetical protein
MIIQYPEAIDKITLTKIFYLLNTSKDPMYYFVKQKINDTTKKFRVMY